MEVKKGYKQTEVGLIPEDWKVFPVSDLGETKRGAGSPCIRYKQSGGVRLIRINDFFQDNPVYVEPTDEIMRYSIHERDLLFAGTGASAGASYLPKKDWIGLPHSYNAPRIRVFENHCKEYLLYSLQSDYVNKQQRAWFVGNAQPFLDTKAISSFSIAVPPTQCEQKTIATALSDADELIASLEKLIAKKQYIKQGTMQQLLTGKQRLPGFSGKWEEKSLFELADNRKELFDDGDWIEAEFLTEDGIRLIQTGNIGKGIFLEKDNKKYISEESFKKLRCKEVKEGDILICRLAEPAGRACIMPLIGEYKVITAVDVSIFRPLQTMADRRYLVNVFSTNDWFNVVNEKCGGSTRTRIARGALGKIKLHLPLLPEQQAIAQILSDMDIEIELLEQKREKYTMIKQGMMQELLTGRIRLV